jgi:DNA-binding CsgD family transcriptional regulator
VPVQLTDVNTLPGERHGKASRALFSHWPGCLMPWVPPVIVGAVQLTEYLLRRLCRQVCNPVHLGAGLREMSALLNGPHGVTALLPRELALLKGHIPDGPAGVTPRCQAISLRSIRVQAVSPTHGCSLLWHGYESPPPLVPDSARLVTLSRAMCDHADMTSAVSHAPSGHTHTRHAACARLPGGRWLAAGKGDPPGAEPVTWPLAVAFTAGAALAVLAAAGLARRQPPGAVSDLPPVPGGCRRQHATGADSLAALTGQERKVLELIAEGLTNRQIARRMFLAEKTAKNYVSSVLAKLGMQSRSQAAAFYARLHAGD